MMDGCCCNHKDASKIHTGMHGPPVEFQSLGSAIRPLAVSFYHLTGYEPNTLSVVGYRFEQRDKGVCCKVV